jgi:hypothetical protein
MPCESRVAGAHALNDSASLYDIHNIAHLLQHQIDLCDCHGPAVVATFYAQRAPASMLTSVANGSRIYDKFGRVESGMGAPHRYSPNHPALRNASDRGTFSQVVQKHYRLRLVPDTRTFSTDSANLKATEAIGFMFPYCAVFGEHVPVLI